MDKKVFGFTGLSGSGKTTLIAQVIDWMRQQGLTVSAIKHTHHGFDLDSPGKDSWRMREAGAGEVWLVSNRRSVLMQEFRDRSEPTVPELVARMAPCDVVIVEGFKRDPTPKIEVHRPSLDFPPVWPSNPSVVAVATDGQVTTDLPTLDLNDVAAIGGFVLRYLGLILPASDQ